MAVKTIDLGKVKGEQGIPGINGRDGKDGKDGRDGANGKSAYQIWLDAGNVGSEHDFLNSLKSGESVGINNLSKVITITGSQAYTPSPGVSQIKVHVIGAGGGGGGYHANEAQYSGGGGAGGGYCMGTFKIKDIPSSVECIIGAGGKAGAYDQGGWPGGNSSFGVYMTAYGGGGGARHKKQTQPTSGGIATGGILNIQGGDGGRSGQPLTGQAFIGGRFGAGGVPSTIINIKSSNGSEYRGEIPARTGGDGLIIIEEYK